MARPLYQMIASRMDTLRALLDRKAHEASDEQPGSLDALISYAEDCLQAMLRLLPQGSGYDAEPTVISYEPNRELVLEVPYHPMDEYGIYLPWVHAKVTVTPTLSAPFDIQIDNVEDESLSEYICEEVLHALTRTYTHLDLGINIDDYIGKKANDISAD